MSELSRRVRFLFRRGQFERELDEEMRFHLAMKAEDAGGVPFGNIALLKEDSRAMWRFVFWEQLGQDIRYGLRAMAANKVFTAMAVLSLALGIGANTAIYSFMDAVLLRTLPVRHPEDLVIAKWRSKGNPAVIHGMNGTRNRDGKTGSVSPNFPYAAYETLRAKNDCLSTLFGYAYGFQLTMSVDGQAEVVNGQYVSGGFFAGLGVNPAAGRPILDDDDRAGAAPVAVIGYSYWQRRLGLNPAAVGKQILINGKPFTIAGVAAPGFFGVDAGRDVPVYLPLHAVTVVSIRPGGENDRFADRNFYWIEAMGRLRPGVTQVQAQTQLAGLFHGYAESTASTEKERVDMPELWLDEGASGIDSLRRQYSKPLLVLMTMVGLILAIACANIANLLLVRASARRREMAVRLSLGAGRMRVIRQLLTESLLLSVAGGLLGLVFAQWGIRSIAWLLANDTRDTAIRANLSWPVLGFTLALAIATGIVFGLAPAMQATKVDLTPALKETRSSAPQARTRRFGLRIGLSHALVVSQIAISLMLVAAAGLFVHTLTNLRAVELGFNQENLLLFNVNARQAGYKDTALANLYGGLLDRFRAVPGVRSASLSQNPLVSGYWNDERLTIPGSAVRGDKPLSTPVVTVDPAFLATMQIPMVLGRALEARDVQSPRVAVVSEQFAKQFFPRENPVGRRIGIGDTKKPADIEIVGVAKDSRYNDLKHENPPVAYVPYTQDLAGLSRATFELRTVGNPLPLANTIRQIVHQASPAVPVSQITTQAAAIDQIIGQERTFADLCTCFALLALGIACVGLYGTMAYAVARRTGEIGIRMALGAERGGIVWMVLRQALVLTAVGLAIGIATVWETAHLLASFLFGMKPVDPWALAVAVAVLVGAAVAAGYGPARRASRVDPMVALRHE